MAGVCKQTIKSLEANAQNTIIVGIIVNTLNPKLFQGKSNFRSGSQGVWSLTLRDSEDDTINITVWGSELFINGLSRAYHIGSVVDVINAKIQTRNAGDRNELYMPTVSSPYHLTVSEGSALIQSHSGFNNIEYGALLKIPFKKNLNLYTFSNAMKDLDLMLNQFIDVLIVITFIGGPTTIVTRKDGRKLLTADFEATDGTSFQTFKLWENDWVLRSQAWEPRNTILLLTDAQILFDKYKKKYAITIVRKTAIVENPNIPEAAKLRASVKLGAYDVHQDPFIVPNPLSITKVMTINEITLKLNETIHNHQQRNQFVAVLFAEMSEIDLDNEKPGVVLAKCSICKRIVQKKDESCMNLECPCGNGRKPPENNEQFYIKVNFKDETGYLIGCRFTGPAADKFLNMTPAEFQELTIEERIRLKTDLLFKTYDVRLQIVGPSETFSRTIYNILALELKA